MCVCVFQLENEKPDSSARNSPHAAPELRSGICYGCGACLLFRNGQKKMLHILKCLRKRRPTLELKWYFLYIFLPDYKVYLCHLACWRYALLVSEFQMRNLKGVIILPSWHSLECPWVAHSPPKASSLSFAFFLLFLSKDGGAISWACLWLGGVVCLPSDWWLHGRHM